MSDASVFLSGGDAAPDVPLSFVDLQNLFGLQVETAVEQGQTFRNILMYCAFTDSKLLCGGTDGGPVLYDVKSQALGPVLHIPFQTIHSPPCGGSSYAGRERDMRTVRSFEVPGNNFLQLTGSADHEKDKCGK